MQKIVTIATVVFLLTACKQKSNNVADVNDANTYVVDTMYPVPNTPDTSVNVPPPPYPAGKLAATATDEVEGKDGKIVSFTYDNNASTVSFELNGKQVVLASKEKISDMPTPNGRTYSNDELTYNNKNGIKISDKKGKLIFEEKQ